MDLVPSNRTSAGKERTSGPRQDSPPKLRKEFTLALVVKGSELNNIQNDQRLSLTEAETLLERASYFAYSSEPEMRQVFSQVQFSAEPVDRQSEQLVLVSIDLLSYQPLSSRRFPNKIELVQHMREDAQEFSVQEICGLETIGKLVEAGFIGV